jgi:Xaa-Pro dipeptidase
MDRTQADKIFSDTAVRVVSSGSIPKAICLAVKENGIEICAFSSSRTTVLENRALSNGLNPAKLVDSGRDVSVDDMIHSIRMKKQAHEIDLLRRAADAAVKICKRVGREIVYGMTEKDIFSGLRRDICAEGLYESFPPIVASGRNTAFPHALPTGRKYSEGEHVLVDMGVKYGGYCSDLTRTFYKGRINRQIRDFRDIVLKAHEKAIKSVRPGVAISRVVSSAEKVFSDNGANGFVLHGLGHGIGLEVHERPYLRQNSGVLLEKGMVFTIEPGLYKEGLGGIRHEDMVLVTDNGYEVLTKW